MGFVRRYALTLVLVLVVACLGLTVYTVIRQNAERTATILRECEQQNARHDGTIHQLDVELAQALKRPGLSAFQRQQIKSSRGFTILLIDQLAPKQNCQQVLAAASKV